MSPRLLARFLRSRCVAGSRDDRRVVNAVGRGEMMIGLALCVVPLAFYAWLVDRRPGAWSNGIVRAVGLGMAGLTAAGIIVRTVPVIGSLIVGTLVVVAALGTAVLPFLLIVNGVEMWRKEGRSLSNVLSGALGVGLLVLMAWCLRSVFSPFEPWAVAGISATMALGWLSFGFLGYLASVFVIHRAKPLPGNHQIVVLGSALVKGKVPKLLASRLDRGIGQWRTDRDAGFHSVIIPSGGKGDDEPRAEGEAMAESLVEHGISRECVVVENQAANTDENISLSRQVMPTQVRSVPSRRAEAARQRQNPQVVVATSSYHAVRAAELCRRQGLRVRVLGAPTATYFLPSAMLREYIALLASRPWINGIMLVLVLAFWPIVTMALR